MWHLEGWALDEDGTRLQVTAGVRGRVEMGQFIQIDFLDMAIEGFDGQIWGSSTVGFESAQQGYSMSTRFNTLPDPIRAAGTFDAGSATFSFQEYNWEGGTNIEEGLARVFIQFQGPDRYIMDTRIQGQQVESYTVVRN